MACTADLVFSSAQIWHSHDLNHKGGPAGKVSGSLALTRFGVVLLPGEVRLNPLIIYRLDKIETQAAVQITGLRLVRARGLSIFLLLY